MAKTDDLGAVETALKNATEAFLVLNQTAAKLTQFVIVIERFLFWEFGVVEKEHLDDRYRTAQKLRELFLGSDRSKALSF